MDRFLFEIAEAVRAACLEAAREAFEDAGVRGLCAEGRCEAALGAIGAVDLARVVSAASAGRSGAGDVGRG